MKEIIFEGSKKEEGFKIYRRAEMQKFLDALPLGEKWEVVLRKKKKKRSNQQNKYYHSVVIPSVLEGLIDAGYERRELNAEVVHEYLCNKFLKKDIGGDTGEFITIVKHTSELSTVDMMNYIDDIIRWSAEFLSIAIPLPGEQVNLDL